MLEWTVRRANTDTGITAWPRVAILHSFYRSANPSGENATVLRQFDWLAAHGIDVSLVSVATDDISNSAGYRLRSAMRVMTGRGASPLSVLAALRPDVIHIHNLFPNVATHWLNQCQTPIVTTLHNYRPLCAAATLYRDGQECTLCVKGSVLNGLARACYRGSRIATFPLTVRSLRGATNDPVLRRPEVLLAPSETVRQAYSAAGVSHLRVLLQPTPDRGPVLPHAATSQYLFIGRLTPEKGVLELLRAWPKDRGLVLVGQGPLDHEVTELIAERELRVDRRSSITDSELTELLRTSRALIFPSLWREGAPAVYAEALSAGLPVISLRGNAVAEFVERDGTGAVVEQLDEESLIAAMEVTDHGGNALRSRSASVFERDYSVDRWLDEIRGIYEAAIKLRPGEATSQP